MVTQILFQFSPLLVDVWEIDEESGAHVHLSVLHFFGASWLVVLTQQVAVFKQTSAPDLFWILGSDQLFVEVIERLVEVSEHALAHDRWVEVFCDRCILATLVEEKESVEHDVK